MPELRPPRYLKSMNKFVIGLQKLGIRTGPAMVLTVPGRKTGRPRSTPMTPFEHRGGLYTVAGYPGADWAANARAAGAGIALPRPQIATGQDHRNDRRRGASGIAILPGPSASRSRVCEAIRAGA